MKAANDVTASFRAAHRPGRISSGLTRREAEVLSLVADRYRNAEIAATLGISKRTVESHIAALLRKLGVRDRTALMRIGADDGAEPAREPDQAVAWAFERTEIVRDLHNRRRRSAQLRAQSVRRRISSAEHVDQSRQLVIRARTLIDPAARSRALWSGDTR